MCEGILPGHFFSYEGFVGLDDFLHFLLDAFEIGRPDRFIEVDIIIEAILDRRAIHEFRLRPEGADSFGHNVSTAMPHYMKTLRVFAGNNF